MDIFLAVLIMLATIGLSNIVNHVFPSIPVPLIQVILGFIIAAIPSGISIYMDPHLFFVVFIAPLLFSDGRNVSRSMLWNLRKQILLLALGLVFVTVLAIGYLAHWLIPSIPLSAAFALAAILSPTDIVAVSAISKRVRIPKGIMHLLEGEGLMNDASGLVAFNFAVAATLTGAFSLAEASLSFLMIAIGGFAGGAVLAFLIIRTRVLLRRLGMEDVTVHMLIQILTPFVIFLAVEHFHLSGILAVVTAGIVHAVDHDHEESPNIQLQFVSKSTWSVLLYILNGLVFVMLGLQIPDILNEIFQDPNFNNMKVIGYTLIITAALFILRFIWIYLFWSSGWGRRKSQRGKLDVRTVAVATISGVRGSVTLAGAFSIPFVLTDGSLFPERSLIIFIAAGVILVTLIAASILLPMITKRKEELGKSKGDDVEKNALILTYHAAIRTIKGLMNEENRQVALSVITAYNRSLHSLRFESKKGGYRNFKRLEMEIRMRALEAESQYIAKLAEERRIDKETALLFQKYISDMEAAATNRLRYRGLVLWVGMKRIVHSIARFFMREKQGLCEKRSIKYKEMSHIKIDMAEVAIQAVKKGITPENEEISMLIIGQYNKLISKIKSSKDEKEFSKLENLERELQDRAFQAERDEVQRLFEAGKISVDITRKIRQQINIREAYFMEEK